MSNQESRTINDENSGGEFSRHWLLVLVCAAGIGVGPPRFLQHKLILIANDEKTPHRCFHH